MGIILMDTTGRTTTDRIRTMAPITQGHHTIGTAGIAITATIVTITTVIGIDRVGIKSAELAREAIPSQFFFCHERSCGSLGSACRSLDRYSLLICLIWVTLRASLWRGRSAAGIGIPSLIVESKPVVAAVARPRLGAGALVPFCGVPAYSGTQTNRVSADPIRGQSRAELPRFHV